ncbi:MAG: PAS domain-containing sensor histidine kinase [Prolixibacteraceae bacterium]|nr:PAS domain-containing sensor histidine kinase [Prolixibacteraceae bacterium]MBN2775486.1 PAS domain-containing sensor histidine kinase [Prolixibacteraceae bacterium]
MKATFVPKNINQLPPHEKQRIIELMWINSVGLLISVFLFAWKIFFNPETLCLPCELGVVILLLISLFCLFHRRAECAINMVFFVPLFIYGYYLSDFHDHLPPSETIYHSIWWIIIAMIYLNAFSKRFRKVLLFSAFSLAILIFHIAQAGKIDEYSSSNQLFLANPVIIFLIALLAAWFVRKFFENRLKDARKLLAETTRQISELVKTSKQPILYIKAKTDEDGQVTDLLISQVNPAFEQNFAIKGKEVVDQKVSYVFNYVFRNTIDANNLLIIDPKPQKEVYLEHLDKWFNINIIRPSKDQFICIFYDTTAQNQLISSLKESRQRFKVLLEAIPDIFFIIDKDGIYEDFVIKERDRLKIKSSEIIGNTIFEVGFSEKMANKIFQCIQDAIANDSIESIEYALDTPNGTFMFEMRLAKLNSNSVISIARDITRRKTMEFKLEEARKIAEDANQLKSVFLANLSHEIRTPMNAIIGSSEILAEMDLPPEEKEIYSNAIITNSHELMKMIDDTISLSKIETDTVDVNIKFCEVNATMKELYNVFKPVADTNKNIDFELSLDIKNPHFGFETDRNLLFEAMSKLIDNALKFTKSGFVKFGYEMISPTKIEFYVEDTGKGISADNIDLIYDRYYKVEAINTVDNRGSGLGLSIAKEFVTLIGGRLFADSELGKGSRFSFNLQFKSGEGYMKIVK